MDIVLITIYAITFIAAVLHAHMLYRKKIQNLRNYLSAEQEEIKKLKENNKRLEYEVEIMARHEHNLRELICRLYKSTDMSINYVPDYKFTPSIEYSSWAWPQENIRQEKPRLTLVKSSPRSDSNGNGDRP